MMKSFTALTLALALLAAPSAFAQGNPESTNGSSPQAGVAGPADGAKGGTNSNGTATGGMKKGGSMKKMHKKKHHM